MKATNFNKPTKEQLTAAFAYAWGDDKHMTDYCVKKTDTAVILSSGAIFTIDKEDINTRFCFGYSTCGQGAEYDESIKAERHAAASLDYFRRKNTTDSAEAVERAKNAPYIYTYTRYLDDNVGAVVSVLMLDESAEYCREYHRHRLPNSELHPVSDSDRAAIIAAYEEHHRKHCKKVETYLKRYGLSKVKTWTYWVDE